MILETILKRVPHISFEGVIDTEITGVEMDSRKVKKGNLFVCIEGFTVDGHNFIEQAINQGATAIIVQKDVPEYNASIVKVKDTVRALSQISSLFYDYPTRDLEVVGVTGTNGKTSITHFLNQLYKNKGERTGMLGTMYHEIAGEKIESLNTTPFANELQQMFYQMKEKDVKKVFMEVSSHALAMGRVWGVNFKHAIFTNLTQDHLDYHGTMDNYKHAKSLLFTSLGYDYSQNKYAILNADDETSDEYTSKTGANIITYGVNNQADIKGDNIKLSATGLEFDLRYKNQTVHIETKILGKFNVYNLLSVAAFCIADGWDIEEIAQGIKELKPVKGRLEVVESTQQYQVIVDYAHTPDGLENVLQTLEAVKKGKIITVVGCGGNRDIGKRPIMASISEKYSDLVILTSDNPRDEEPQIIIDDMKKGLVGKNYIEEIDREIAIKKAIELANKDDIVIIAGKGHEEYQITKGEKIAFSDVEKAKTYM